MPLVSIVIPAHNAAPYLPAALQSCNEQTHSNLEIIVIDDGSTDATARVVAQHPAVTYIYQDNAGPGHARNTGIEAANGAFIQFLDADDVLLPQKITRSLAVFDQHPNASVVYSNYEWRTPDLAAPVTEAAFLKTGSMVPPDDMLDFLLTSGSAPATTSCALCRTASLRAVKGFDERLFIGEDWFLWVKLAAAGQVIYPLDEALVWYRHTPGSLTSDGLRMARQRLRAYQQLREVSLPPRYDVDEMIAMRHHVLAMKLWAAGNRREARAHFRHAIREHPQRRAIRRILSWASYLIPVRTVEGVLALYGRLFRKHS
jgi:glycosyltransferase involved in cell wall biosynthesis